MSERVDGSELNTVEITHLARLLAESETAMRAQGQNEAVKAEIIKTLSDQVKVFIAKIMIKFLLCLLYTYAS